MCHRSCFLKLFLHAVLKVHCESSVLFYFLFSVVISKYNITSFIQKRGSSSVTTMVLAFPRSRFLSCRCHVVTPRNVVLLCSVFIFWWGLLGPSCNGMSGICFLYCESSSVCYNGIKYDKVYNCCAFLLYSMLWCSMLLSTIVLFSCLLLSWNSIFLIVFYNLVFYTDIRTQCNILWKRW